MFKQTTVLAVVTLILFGGTVSAQNRRLSLERASDSALLSELSVRGYTCDAPEDGIIISASCDPYTNLITEVYDDSGRKIDTNKIFLSSIGRCEAEKARLSNAFGRRVFRAKTVAICDPYTNLIKINVSHRGISEVEKTFMSSSARCSTAADEFNHLFK